MNGFIIYINNRSLIQEKILFYQLEQISFAISSIRLNIYADFSTWKLSCDKGGEMGRNKVD